MESFIAKCKFTKMYFALMRGKLSLPRLAAAVIGLAAIGASSSQRSVWDGIYTTGQAKLEKGLAGSAAVYTPNQKSARGTKADAYK